MGMTNNQRRDYDKFYVAKPDPDFNPERARAVIDGTIRKSEEARRRKRQQFAEGLGERSEAVASYLRSRSANTGNPIESYLGKRDLAHLQGRKILERIKNVNGQKIITFESI
jgi:hypothetical protein